MDAEKPTMLKGAAPLWSTYTYSVYHQELADATFLGPSPRPKGFWPWVKSLFGRRKADRWTAEQIAEIMQREKARALEINRITPIPPEIFKS